MERDICGKIDIYVRGVGRPQPPRTPPKKKQRSLKELGVETYNLKDFARIIFNHLFSLSNGSSNLIPSTKEEHSEGVNRCSFPLIQKDEKAQILRILNAINKKIKRFLDYKIIGAGFPIFQSRKLKWLRAQLVKSF